MTADPYMLAVDVGTSALKAVVYARDGQTLAASTQRHAYTTPQPGWAEADPEAWWQAFQLAMVDLHQLLPGLETAQALALSGQMHTAVLLDEAGEVVPPTILWLDRRATVETAELQAHLRLPPYHLNSTYTLPKLYWLARHMPEVVQRVACILWPKDYLRFRMTGERLTDYTEAGGAALLDWQTLTWATSRLELIGLDPAILPSLRWPQEDGGSLLPGIAARFGLRDDVKVIVGAGDVLALIAGTPPVPGQVTCSLGSSSMVFGPMPPGQTVADPADRLYVYPLLPYPLLGGVSSTTGAAVQWAWHMLYDGQVPFDEAVQQALATPPGADGLLFLPFLSGERSPFWNDGLRGAFYGLTLAHSRAHLMRAVLEGVAFSLRHLIDIFAELGAAPQSIALAGGGVSVPGLPQLLSDVCRLPVRIYAGQETVTRALYAYACLALGDDKAFDQALARTFAAPVEFVARAEDERHEVRYRIYRQLAQFADQKLSQSETALIADPS